MCVCSLRVYQLRTGAVKPRLLVRPVTQIPERSLVHQEGLPKLPVPPLKQTCEGYLAALEPIVSAEELDHTRQLVGEFLHGGVGERLQKGLERRARKTENWVDIWAYSADDSTFNQMKRCVRVSIALSIPSRSSQNGGCSRPIWTAVCQWQCTPARGSSCLACTSRIDKDR